MMSILFVCEGNICRSPYAAVAFAERRRARAGRSGTINSAGLRAPRGRPAHGELHRFFLDEDSLSSLERHRSTPLDARLIREHDLIVTMERRQRQDVLDLVPAALRRTFSLGELARSSLMTVDATTEPQDDLASLVGQHRLSPGFEAMSDDVPDPVCGTSRHFVEMAQQIDLRLSHLDELLARYE